MRNDVTTALAIIDEELARIDRDLVRLQGEQAGLQRARKTVLEVWREDPCDLRPATCDPRQESCDAPSSDGTPTAPPVVLLDAGVPRHVQVLARTPAGTAVRVHEVAAAVDAAQSHVSGDLRRLARRGYVESVAPGEYRRTAAGSEVLETVWCGASRRPLIDREDPSQATQAVRA